MKPFKAVLRAFALACAGLMSLSTARADDIVVTHYGSLLYGVPYAIAMEKGWFKEAGVDVNGILTSKGGGTSVRNMMAGDTLFAEVALPAALSAIREGFNIKILSGGTDGSSGFWVTRVGEAIDIYVNNRLVARGEVVLVEDKLGVTMTEIIKAERG